jgi:hypothetical protein
MERRHQGSFVSVVNKGRGKPNLIIGDFVNYLLRRHNRRVKFITVLPG